jgi:hypothetical protein
VPILLAGMGTGAGESSHRQHVNPCHRLEQHGSMRYRNGIPGSTSCTLHLRSGARHIRAIDSQQSELGYRGLGAKHQQQGTPRPVVAPRKVGVGPV